MKYSIKNLINNGFILVSPPKEAILFEGRLVAFLYGPFGLIEILNKKNEHTPFFI